MKRHWTTQDMSPQKDRRVIITGATGGLGWETALALAACGADVVLTGRNDDKGHDALWTLSAGMTGAVWPRGTGVGVESRSRSSPFSATAPAAMRSFSPASR